MQKDGERESEAETRRERGRGEEEEVVKEEKSGIKKREDGTAGMWEECTRMSRREVQAAREGESREGRSRTWIEAETKEATGEMGRNERLRGYSLARRKTALG